MAESDKSRDHDVMFPQPPPPATSAMVIGAGIAGLACARRLRDAGWSVTVFDKGRRVGGRMASRDTDVGVFDHGAQFFTVREPAFAAVVHAAEAQGAVQAWPLPNRDEPVWTGAPTMQHFPAWLAQGLNVHCSHAVQRVHRMGAAWCVAGESPKGVFEHQAAALVITMPIPQLVELLGDRRWPAVAYAPSWTVMLQLDQPVSLPCLPADHPVLASVIAENTRPGRSGPPRVTLQATAGWSRYHLEQDTAMVTPRLVQAFIEFAGVTAGEVHVVSAHRWRYALVERPAIGPHWDPGFRLGAAGDGWAAPRVESAWCSGRSLADRMMASV